MKNTFAISVSELNHAIKNLLEDCFYQCAVTGEVSNLSRPQSGHIYFSLKDQQSQIRCVIWRTNASKIEASIENGSKITVIGHLSVYAPRGEYQIIVEMVQEDGKGNLHLGFERLKQKLEAEGLFEPKNKKSLPIAPKKIGIITSHSSAALQDALSALKRRRPDLPIIVYAASTQGESAASQIIQALQRANDDQDVDVLLLIRGGGSIEDLWCFNNEPLARSIANSAIPIITGIGHETDFTIADFVADLRAPTPTAAAELCCQDQTSLQKNIATLEQHLLQAMQKQLLHLKTHQESLMRQLHIQRPDQKLKTQMNSIGFLEKALQQSINSALGQRRLQFKTAHDHFCQQGTLSLNRLLNSRWQHAYQLEEKMLSSIHEKIKNRQEQLTSFYSILEAISPLKTMQRGFSISYHHDQNTQKATVLRDVHALKINETIETQLSNGRIFSTVTKIITQDEN